MWRSVSFLVGTANVISTPPNPALQWSSPHCIRFGYLFCFQPGPFLTCFQRIFSVHARIALWFGLTFGVFNQPRLFFLFFLALWIYFIMGSKKASNACLAWVNSAFSPHTHFDWIHPLVCVSEGLAFGLPFLWQAYSMGRSILLTLWKARRVQYRDASQLTLDHLSNSTSGTTLPLHKTEDGMKRERSRRPYR